MDEYKMWNRETVNMYLEVSYSSLQFSFLCASGPIQVVSVGHLFFLSFPYFYGCFLFMSMPQIKRSELHLSLVIAVITKFME